MNTIEYLSRTKQRLNIDSDYALAKALDVTRQTISKMQKGSITLGDETALKVAEILDLHPVMVLADAHAERERNPEVQRVWRNLVEKISMGFNDFIKAATPRRIKLSA